MGANSLFISYSHREKRWLDRLNLYLAQLRQEGMLDLWDDTRIKPGADWRSEISLALKRAKAAILLVGPAFLASEFIVKEELPVLLGAAADRGISIYPLIIGYCGYQTCPLKAFQAFNEPDKPLEALPKAKQNKILNDLSSAVSLEMLQEAPRHQAIGRRQFLAEWQQDRALEYARTDGYMLVHTYRPSIRSGQDYEIFIFLVRHRKGTI